jgi:phosphoribosylformylglycinamidine synthase
VLEAIRAGWVQSAHDCSDGGLGVALAESCIGGRLGAEIELPADLPAEAWLFSESQSRVVLSVAEGRAEALRELAAKHQVPLTVLGKVGGERLAMRRDGAVVADRAVDEMEQAYRSSIACLMT